MELLKKAKDKNFWLNIRNNPEYKFLIDSLLKQYNDRCITDSKALKFSQLRMFVDNGNRKLYEHEYFDLMYRMNILTVLSLLYPENDEYLEKLQDAIWSILDMYTWSLPAHLPPYDGRLLYRFVIDLFASQTGYELSEIYVLLGDRLHPLIKQRIKREVEERIIYSYIDNPDTFWWDIDSTNNWTAVCTCYVAGTIMLMHPELFMELKPRFDTNMERYLGDFNDDCVCREGLSYWNYGFGKFSHYAYLLKEFSDGEFDYFKESKIKGIATFGEQCFLQDNVTVSFSDGSMTGSFDLDLNCLLKSVYPNLTLPDKKYANVTVGCRRILTYLVFSPDHLTKSNPEDKEIYFEDSQWLLKKSAKLAFAAKGGDNEEPHNHNDIGSFIVSANGKQLLCDLGAGEYTRQYFGPERYTIFCNSSLGHSVPIFDGEEQKEGKEYCGKTSYSKGKFTVDMTKAYGIEKLKSAIRHFDLAESEINLHDEIDLEAETEITERFVSLYTPEIKEGQVIVDCLSLVYDNSWDVTVTAHEHSTHTAEKIFVYSIDFTKKSTSTVFDLKIKLN